MNAVATKTRFMPLTIFAVERLTADAVALTLRPPAAAAGAFRFLPGQHLTLRRVIGGEEVRRSYSLCAGLDEGVLQVAVKRVPSGRFSTWAVEEARPGDVIDALPPAGSFVFRPDPAAARTVLGIAAGSGITPILSIARTLLSREPESQFILLFGNRTSADIMFREAIEDLKDRHLSRFAVVHVLSREALELPALHGRLDGSRLAALLPGLARPAEIDAAYVCGPAGLPESAEEALIGLGVARERVLVERFIPPGGSFLPPQVTLAAAKRPQVAQLSVTVDGARREVPMAEGETVLEAVLRAGIDAPWSCRGGMCCSCRAKLTEGEVAMDRNWSLQPWELAAGFVLTCQSRPKTARLAVDYDAV